MILLLHGPDSARRLKKQRALIEEFQRQYPAAPLERFDAEEEGMLARLEEFLRSDSLFSSRRFAVVGGVVRSEGAGAWKRTVLPYRESAEVHLIFSLEGAPPRSLQLVFHGARVQEFPLLQGAALSHFIEDEARERGLALEAGAVRALRDLFGADTWALGTELDMLACREEKHIYEKDVAAAFPALDFFPLLRGLQGSDARARLGTLERLSLQGEDTAKVFHMLAYGRDARAGRFADYDIAIKKGKMEYEEAVLCAVLER